jgi:hypothetical protein
VDRDLISPPNIPLQLPAQVLVFLAVALPVVSFFCANQVAR